MNGTVLVRWAAGVVVFGLAGLISTFPSVVQAGHEESLTLDVAIDCRTGIQSGIPDRPLAAATLSSRTARYFVAVPYLLE
jgi:hypothetical protein